jgi:hypothetical protein
MMELFMTDRHQHLPAATMLHVLDSTPLRHSRTRHNVVGQQARDEQQRDGRREGRTQQGRAHVLAPPQRAARAPQPTGVCHRAKLPSLIRFWHGCSVVVALFLCSVPKLLVQRIVFSRPIR